MAYLIDTSILARLVNTADVHHVAAARAVLELHRRGETLHITPQVLIEFRGVATRPAEINGLGLSQQIAEEQTAAFESAFDLLAETPDISPAWKKLVNALGVVGKQVHDARLVAVCHVYRVTHLLTFNSSHFSRLAEVAPGIVAVNPTNL